MPSGDGGATGDVTIRFARPEDVPEAARGFSECFRESIWARLGVRSSAAYLSHCLRDAREFLIVADHPRHGIVGACTGTMRMGRHRRGILVGSFPRLGLGAIRDVARDPRSGVELVTTAVQKARGRLAARGRPPAPIEHVAPELPLRIDSVPGYLTTYYVSPAARGQHLAARMTDFGVEIYRRQGFEWLELHVHSENFASQKIVMRCGFRLVWTQGTHFVYRRYIGEGEPGDMEVRTLEDPTLERTLRETWSSLLAKTPEGSGFHAWPWVSAHLPEVARPWIGVVSLRGQPVAVFPFQLDGGRLALIAESRSNYGGPVYDPAHLPTVVAGFRQLVEKSRARLVDLRGIRERSPFREAVAGLVLGDLGRAVSVNTIGCPEVELERGWSKVLSRHRSKHRKSWQRSERKLQKLGKVEFEELTDPDAIADALPDAVRLYEARWEGLNVQKALGHAQAEFQRNAAKALAREGHAVLSVIRLDGEMIAFSYSLRANGVSNSYALAHDDRYAIYSPGQLLLIKVLEQATARGDSMFDFSVGDEAYKDQWSTGRQEVFRMVWGGGAPALTAVDALKARLRSRPALRRLKREGLRALVPTRPARSVVWHVQRLPAGERHGVDVVPLKHAEMRALLEGDVFRVAIDRAFRGDTALALRDGGEPVAVVWRVASSRRAAIARGVERGADDEVYLQPKALRSSADLGRLLRAAGPGLLVATETIFPQQLARFDADPWLADPPRGD